MIETDKLIINDFDTIAELNTFARDKDTYKAEEGNYDDLVMGLVQFAWLAAQNYFRDSTNIDIRRVLVEENNMSAEEDLLPVGIIDNGQPEPTIDSKGMAWYDDMRSQGYTPSNF